MNRPDTIRNVLVSVLLSLTALTACSTQGPRDTQEQHETAGTSTRSESTTKEALETAGTATMIVIVLGVSLAVAALPVLLAVFLL
jgi:hypothetical protein